MALGTVPVIIADEFQPPNGPEWEKFCIFVKEKDVSRLPTLLKMYEGKYLEMAQLARESWERFFHPEKLFDYCANALIDCMDSSTVSTSSDIEFKRWDSFYMYLSNNWTIPNVLDKDSQGI